MQSLNFNTEYALQATEKGVSFVAFRGDTTTATDSETAHRNERINAECRGYFLRKGFAKVLETLDPEIVTPVYKDADGKEVHPESTEQALSLIRDSQINISGFTFSKKAKEDQKEEVFAQMVDAFVETSKNPDLAQKRNNFTIGMTNDLLDAQKSWNGDAKVSGKDVLKELDLASDGIQDRKDYRLALVGRSVSQRSY